MHDLATDFFDHPVAQLDDGAGALRQRDELGG
jgi:hypothetical protein